jgi:hypothetical protein
MKHALLSLYLAGPGAPGGSATGIPSPTRGAPADLADKVKVILGIAMWAGTAAGVAGVIITGTMMAVSMKRGEGSEHFSRLGMVLGGCILVTTASSLISFAFN